MEQNTQTTSPEEQTGVQQPAPENGSTRRAQHFSCEHFVDLNKIAA